MPNWIVHMAATAPFNGIFRNRDWRFILLGSIVPDIFIVLKIIIEYLSENFFILYYSIMISIFFHTIVVNLIVAAGISMFFNNKRKVFVEIASGIIIHILLDMTQFHIGFYKPVFAPICFSNINFSGYYTDSKVYLISTIISVLLIIFILIHHKRNEEIKFRISIKGTLILLFSLVLVLLMLTYSNISKNVYTSFYLAPWDFKNKTVYFRYGSVNVKNSNETIFRYKGKDYILDIDTNFDIKDNDRISLTGKYSNNKVYVKKYYKRKRKTKEITSIIGLLILIKIWFF